MKEMHYFFVILIMIYLLSVILKTSMKIKSCHHFQKKDQKAELKEPRSTKKKEKVKFSLTTRLESSTSKKAMKTLANMIQ
jgi:hypothetical protein